MRPEDFRRLALGLPEVFESFHMHHPDFRVGGKVFATLGYPNEEFAMVKLAPEDQEAFVQINPEAFSPVPGGWGKQGATNVRLKVARKTVVRDALHAAWRNRAPKKPTWGGTKSAARKPRARSGIAARNS